MARALKEPDARPQDVWTRGEAMRLVVAVSKMTMRSLRKPTGEKDQEAGPETLASLNQAAADLVDARERFIVSYSTGGAKIRHTTAKSWRRWAAGAKLTKRKAATA